MQTKTSLTIQTQLDNLKAKVKKKQGLLTAKKRKAAVSERSQNRQDGERRQFLAGAYVLAALQKIGQDASTLQIGEQSLEEWLVRDADRVVFNLQALTQKNAGVSGGESTSAADDEAALKDVPMEMYEESLDIEEQARADGLEGEADGMLFNQDPIPSETMVSGSEAGSNRSDETLAALDAPAATHEVSHDADLLGLDQTDWEQTQDRFDEDHF